MAVYFDPKPSAAVRTYKWHVPLEESDAIVSATVVLLSGTAAVDSYEIDGDDISFTVSGGTSGASTTFTGTVVTSLGDTIKETLYVAVLNETNLGTTGEDIASYVLRKISGIGETPDADQVADCLERITDMLAMWRSEGFNLGIPLPVATSTVFTCDDGLIPGIKANAILACADLYGAEISPVVVAQARYGLQRIKAATFDNRTASAVYY